MLTPNNHSTAFSVFSAVNSAKTMIYLLLMLFIPMTTFSQSVISGRSNSQKIHISPAPKFPPNLEMDVDFLDPSGNGALDGEEQAVLQFILRNSGQGEAINVQIKVVRENDIKGVTIGSPDIVNRLNPSQQQRIDVGIIGSIDLLDGSVRLRVSATEGNGFDLTPDRIINIPTKAFQPPKLVIADVGIDDASGNGQIEHGEIVNVSVRIQNQGYGGAVNVEAYLRLGDNLFLGGDSKRDWAIGNLASGAYKDIHFSFYANNRATSLPIDLELKEIRKKFNTEERLHLSLNKPQKRALELTIQATESERGTITPIGGLSVDIHKDLPKAKRQNNDAVAVVIGNKNYNLRNRDVPDVEHALRDSEWIKQYLITSLGFKEGNILYYNDVTLGDLRNLFGSQENHQGQLANIIKRNQSDVFVYYSGHGAPDLKENKGYLVPVDCHPNSVDRNGYPVDLLYANLDKIEARSITVVIDACFSGGSAQGTMLVASASPIGIRVTDPTINWKNGALFTSASNTEVSNWYPEMKHSLFTYMFLKGLKGEADLDRNGVITTGEMNAYLSDVTNGVPYYARSLHNGRQQTPQFYGKTDLILR